MELNEAVSRRLQELLSERGMTQYQLYQNSGVPKSTISNIVHCQYDSVKLRAGIRKQLQYIRRDIGFIADIIRSTHLKVSEKVANLLNTITTLYEQQLYMYENRVHTVPDCIVSISRPWVRPIVRGEAHANTEFGAKLHISMVDGYAKIERLSFDAYNEATDFFSAVEAYRQEHGCYPQYQDICNRNIVEGEFGVGKRSYGLNRIMAHLPEISFCVIGVALLCMNLTKRLRSLLRHFLQICLLSVLIPDFEFHGLAE